MYYQREPRTKSSVILTPSLWFASLVEDIRIFVYRDTFTELCHKQNKRNAASTTAAELVTVIKAAAAKQK